MLAHVAFCDVVMLLCTERGPHSVCRAWADYNTLMVPALYLEQDDHLPYPATQVGYYRWMYDKDPGHQYACLGVRYRRELVRIAIPCLPAISPLNTKSISP